MRNPLNFIDLFAGGGGLSEGFIQEGYEPIAHVEADQAACNTLRTRMAYHWLGSVGRLHTYADYLTGRIGRQELYASVPPRVVRSVVQREIRPNGLRSIYREIDAQLAGRSLDVIVGGPPCQAYSLVGRSRDPNGMIEDKRNYLYRCYAKFLERYRPMRFVFENVTGLLSARNGNGQGHFDVMRSVFERLGYETEFSTVSAKDYGVLQNRKRVILVGHRIGTGHAYPTPERWTPDATVADALKGLPAIGAGEGHPGPCRVRRTSNPWQIQSGVRSHLPVTWHQARPHTARDLEIYRIAVRQWNERKARLHYGMLPKRLKTHRNRQCFVDRFKVVAADLPFAQTVVAHICKDGHYYIHPDIDQNRSLTPREAARLQTFPDDYYFESVTEAPSRTHAYRQIGNAVPVQLARRVAAAIRDDWD